MVNGAMAVAQPRSLSARLTSWVGTHLLPVFTVAGFVVYGLLRVSYANFYGRFDVDPEEVGLGQTTILVQTGLVVFASTLLSGALMMLGFLGYKALGLRPLTPAPNASFWVRALAFMGGPYWMVGITSVVLFATIVLYDLPNRARTRADQVERGETVRTTVSFLNLDLPVKALPVKLTTLAGGKLSANLTSPSLRYLGQADGVLVLYDWKAERVIRLPSDSVVVMTSTGEPGR